MSETLVLIQKNPDRAIELDINHPQYGWLFYRHPGGQFVTMQKLQPWEIMQAEDQIIEGIVLDGGHNVSTKSGYRFG